MMWNLTKDVVAPWMRPELIERVAEMLNYFLSQLVSREAEKERRIETERD